MIENFETTFTEMMRHIQVAGLTEKGYAEAIAYAERLEAAMLAEARSRGKSEEQMRGRAEELKTQYRGDVLLALNALGEFTYEKDPRISDDATKMRYLETIMGFCAVARGYYELRRSALGEFLECIHKTVEEAIAEGDVI